MFIVENKSQRKKYKSLVIKKNLLKVFWMWECFITCKALYKSKVGLKSPLIPGWPLPWYKSSKGSGTFWGVLMPTSVAMKPAFKKKSHKALQSTVTGIPRHPSHKASPTPRVISPSSHSCPVGERAYLVTLWGRSSPFFPLLEVLIISNFCFYVKVKSVFL